eukprot:TRINITY_DN9249_c0_g1_i2.p1 TRINITY_DN9249_c0_g1~~TRINITY_DN9249_c0_g1_i2.p1  ORF type:complete len:934 (+),score=144.76 TRINITY_DN9249_c0_g1_i2:69-2870(+)
MNIESLLPLLNGCLSPVDDHRRSCEAGLMEHLRNLETVKCLFMILADGNQHLDCKMITAVALRTYITRHWQTSSYAQVGHTIPDDHKDAIRNDILHLIEVVQGDDKLIKLVGLVVGKIAKYDLAKWKSVLLQALSAGLFNVGDDAKKVKYLITLHMVLVECNMAARLGPGAPAFEALCRELCSAMIEFAKNASNDVMQAISSGNCSRQKVTAASLSHKIMQRVLRGYWDVNSHQQYLENCLQLMEAAVTARGSAKDSVVVSVLDVILKRPMKALVYAYSAMPSHYLSAPSLVPRLLTFSFRIICSIPPFCEKIDNFYLLQCLSVVELTVSKVQSSREASQHMQSVLGQGNSLAQLADVLLTKYLCIHEYEKDLWKCDPEAFVFDQEAEDGDIDVKEKSSQVFAGLLEAGGESFVSEFAKALTPIIEGEQSDSRSKESAYHVMGLGWGPFPEVLTEEQADRWVMSAVRDARQSSDKFLQRRAFWVVGQWAYNIRPSMCAEVYSILIQGMDPSVSQDVVIRITCLESLQHLVSDEFEFKAFVPLINKFFPALINLLNSCNHVELKCTCLAMLGFVVRQVGAVAFADYAASFAELLQRQWNAEAAIAHQVEYKTKVLDSIATCVSQIILFAGSSEPVHGLSCSIIHQSLAVSNPHYLDLADNTVILWLHTIATSTHLSPGLLRCFKEIMFPLLEKDFFEYVTLLQVLRQYVMLGGLDLMQSHGKQIIDKLQQVVQLTKNDGPKQAVGIVEDIICLYPQLREPLSGIIGGMLQIVMAASEREAYQCVEHLVVVCRYVAEVPACLKMLLDNQGLVPLIKRICDFADNDFITRADHRKICAVALTTMLPVVPQQSISEVFNDIVGFVVDAILAEENEFAASYRQSLEEYRLTQFMNHTSLEDEPKPAKDRQCHLLNNDCILLTEMRKLYVRAVFRELFL